MSTRAIIRFATRESGVSFSEHPEKWHAQLFCRLDGQPESLGLDIANSIANRCFIPHDLEIDSLDTKRSDTEYMYYVWQAPLKTTWISIFEVRPFVDQVGECIFVGEPQKLLTKYGSQVEQSYYKLNTNYDG